MAQEAKDESANASVQLLQSVASLDMDAVILLLSQHRPGDATAVINGPVRKGNTTILIAAVDFPVNQSSMDRVMLQGQDRRQKRAEDLQKAKALTRLLLEQNADVNGEDANGMTPLMTASSHGNTEIVSLLLSYKADVHRIDSQGWTALHHCGEHEHVDVFRQLLGAGADPNASDCLGLRPVDARRGIQIDFFEENDHKNRISDLITNQTIANSELIAAARSGKLNRLERALKNGAFIDHKDTSWFSSGGTALHYAAKEGQTDTVRLLLMMNASTSVRDSKGRTPAELSANDAVKELFQRQRAKEEEQKQNAEELRALALNQFAAQQQSAAAKAERELMRFRLQQEQAAEAKRQERESHRRLAIDWSPEQVAVIWKNYDLASNWGDRTITERQLLMVMSHGLPHDVHFTKNMLDIYTEISSPAHAVSIRRSHVAKAVVTQLVDTVLKAAHARDVGPLEQADDEICGEGLNSPLQPDVAEEVLGAEDPAGVPLHPFQGIPGGPSIERGSSGASASSVPRIALQRQDSHRSHAALAAAHLISPETAAIAAENRGLMDRQEEEEKFASIKVVLVEADGLREGSLSGYRPEMLVSQLKELALAHFNIEQGTAVNILMGGVMLDNDSPLPMMPIDESIVIFPADAEIDGGDIVVDAQEDESSHGVQFNV